MIEVKRVPGPARKQLEVLVKGFGKAVAKVGWFETARYEDGTAVAKVAIIQEFGAPKAKIPPRSFMRTTIAERVKEWRELMRKGSKAILAGQYTPVQVLDGLGQQAAGDMRKKIADIQDPPLRPLTLLVRKYRRGMIPGMPPGPLTAKTLGILISKYKSGEIDTDGVTDKPLVDYGILINTLTNTVEK